jgi:hypothetical protein
MTMATIENGWMRRAREDFEAGKDSRCPENYHARVQYQIGWSQAQDSKESLAKREAALAIDPEYVALVAECEAFKAARQANL